MKNPLVELVEGNQEKIFALFEQSGGRLNFEERKGEKGEFLEVKVLNEQARLAGILWFFGPRRAYIEDIRLMVKRKENQKVAMVLLAGDGTTSAGKKELRDVGIKIIKDIDLTEIEVKKKKKKKVAKKKEVEFTDSEDVSLANVPDTPLIKNAKILIERREPEFINIKEIKGAEDETHEFRAYSTTNDILAIYRTVNHDSIGVSAIRDFATAVEEYENISLALVGLDKFTPSAKKEATEKGINLISIAEEIESRGSEEQQQLSERLKDGAIDIINQRGYKVMSNTGAKFSKLFAGSESLGTYLVAQNDNKDVLLVLIPSEEVVRVATVRDFALQIESLKIKEGMLIALKR
ncbi:MAG: hypothetical protein OEZ01_12985, partial [Candidatus Heimdallarchaeota archaeon]|nr:hypothetical protein [Candidatus Heimdallarchaeota archaeon]